MFIINLWEWSRGYAGGVCILYLVNKKGLVFVYFIWYFLPLKKIRADDVSWKTATHSGLK